MRRENKTDKSIILWEEIKHTKTMQYSEVKNPTKFTILSYNILSQALLEKHRYLYFKCPFKSLSWLHRFQLISNEIKSIKPDIICLQELQQSHLKEITEFIESLGFKVLFKKRTRDHPDGCGICYKPHIFDLLENNCVEFQRPEQKLIKYDNIALMVKLLPKSQQSTPFVVCTTHLLYNKKRFDVKVAQTQILLAEIDKFSCSRDEMGNTNHLPVILTGDFNSKPNTYVTDLILKGKINNDTYFIPLKDIDITNQCQYLNVYLERNIGKSHLKRLYSSIEKEGNQKEYNRKGNIDNFEKLFNNDFLEHNFLFKSVYCHTKTGGGMFATTKQDKWVVVDYIYYSSNNITGNLKLKERYRLPFINECYKIGTLPNRHFGSDHFSLAAKFELYEKN